MNGNPHYLPARKERGYDTGRTEAILALAHEQRIANLIAFYGNGQFTGANLIFEEIVKGLGLREWAVEK